LLNKLKAAGFHVVHIVPGTSEQPELASTSPAREAAPANPASATAAPVQSQPSVSTAAAATSPAPPEQKKDGDQPAPAVALSNAPSADSPPGVPSNAPSTDAPPSGGQAATANVEAPAAGETAQPTPAANPDQVANANILAQPEAVPDPSTSVEMPEATSDPSHDPDDPNWPSPVAAAPADDRTELPAPDERAFSIDYRPWRTVKLADGSETAVYLAIDAVPQWTDPPAGEAAGPDNAELPAPAIPPYYFGGDTMTAVAE
jgi:hypothetical protein